MAISKGLEPPQISAISADAWELAAIGVAGSWELSLNRELAEPSHWSIQVDGPAISVEFPVSSPDALARWDDQLAKFIARTGNAAQTPKPLDLSGKSAIELTLIPDDEYCDRYFLLVKSADGVTIRATIGKPVLIQLHEALTQVRAELDAE